MDKIKSPNWRQHFEDLKNELDQISGDTPQKEDYLLVLQNRLEISIKQYLSQYDSQYKYFEPLLQELAKLKKDCRYTDRAKTIRWIFSQLETPIERY